MQHVTQSATQGSPSSGFLILMRETGICAERWEVLLKAFRSLATNPQQNKQKKKDTFDTYTHKKVLADNKHRHTTHIHTNSTHNIKQGSGDITSSNFIPCILRTSSRKCRILVVVSILLASSAKASINISAGWIGARSPSWLSRVSVNKDK